MSDHSGGISQSNSGSMGGGMQAAIGNHNQQAMRSQEFSDSDTTTQAEVVKLLEQIQCIIKDAELPEPAISKATKYIEAAKIEVEESEPDKQLICKNLERVSKNLEEVDKTVDSSKRIFEKIVPLIVKISSWLGIAIASV